MTAHATRRTGIKVADARPAEARATAPALLALFIASLLLPIYFEIGGLRLSPNRLFLLFAFVPLSLRWIAGRGGGITTGDVLIGLYCLWTGFAVLMVHGAARIPFAGIMVVELFGSYLAGRALIRNAADHRLLFRYTLIAMLVLAPFALVEMFTGRRLIHELLEPIFATIEPARGGEQRLGLVRAQSVFDHSILFGLFCSIAIANLFYIHRERLAKGLLLSAFATAMTFMSLSSGPLLAAGLQFALILWGRMTANAWRMLAILSIIGYVAIDLASNRTPIMIIIGNLTFNPASGWSRILIWEYGIAEVWRHPLFGIGLNDWQRGWGVPASVDNFWLLTAMRAGVPAFLLLLAGHIANFARILRADLPSEAARYRTGYVIATTATFMALCTVHLWGSALIFVMFYFGAGLWFANAASESPGHDRVELRSTRSREPEAAVATGRAVHKRTPIGLGPAASRIPGHPAGANHGPGRRAMSSSHARPGRRPARAED